MGFVRRFTDGPHGANRRTLSIEVLAHVAFRLGLAIVTVVAGCVIARPVRAQSTDHPGLQRAVAAYNEGDLALTLAILDELPVSLPARDQAFRNLYRGLVHFATGDIEDARAAFARAVQFQPAVELDPAVHAPSRVTAYTEVRDSMVARWRSQAVRAESEGDLEQARRAWSLVTTATPSDTEARQRLAAVRRQRAESVRRAGDSTTTTAATSAEREDSVATPATREDSIRAAAAAEVRANRDTVAERTVARDSTVMTASRFSPGRALALGLAAPGLGHFYTARPVRGLLVLSAAAGALAAGVFYEKVDIRCLAIPTANVCPPGQVATEESSRPLLLPAIGAAAAITLLGAIDAFAGADDPARTGAGGADAADGPSGRSSFHFEPPTIEADRSRVQLAIVRLRF